MHVVIKATIFVNKFILFLFLIGFTHVIICDSKDTEQSMRGMAKMIFYYSKRLKSNQFRWYSVCFLQLLIPSEEKEAKKNNMHSNEVCRDMPHRTFFTKYTWCHKHTHTHTLVCIYMNISIKIRPNGENHSYIRKEKEKLRLKNIIVILHMKN